MKDLCKVLKLWEEITPFLLITEIKDVDKYKDLLNLWEKLEEFYVVGGRTILTKNPANAGDDETFYFHVLRFYLPKIAKKKQWKKIPWVLVFLRCRDSNAATTSRKIR